MRRATGVIVIAAATAVAVGLRAVYTRVWVDSRPNETWYRIQTFRAVVDSFAHLAHRPPASLDEACLRLTPPGYDTLPHCEYWLHEHDSVPVDDWDHPLRYTLTAGVVEIRSAGVDGLMGTRDDIVYNSVDEVERVRKAAGCYEVDLGWPAFPGRRLQLDSAPMVWHGQYDASPKVRRYFAPDWTVNPFPDARDSVTVAWRTTDEGHVELSLRVFPDSLVGIARGNYRSPHVVARRTTCG